MTSRGLHPISWLSENQRQTKTLLPPAPPTIQRGKEEKKRQIEESRVVKRFDEGGGCLNTGLNKAFKKRTAKEKGWMKRERTSEGHSPKTWTECMCLLTQLITLYRGHGLTLYTTHTHNQVEKDEMSVPIATQFWKSEWTSFAIRLNPVACEGCCYPDSSGKEGLSLAPYTLIVHTERLRSVTGFRYEQCK